MALFDPIKKLIPQPKPKPQPAPTPSPPQQTTSKPNPFQTPGVSFSGGGQSVGAGSAYKPGTFSGGGGSSSSSGATASPTSAQQQTTVKEAPKIDIKTDTLTNKFAPTTLPSSVTSSVINQNLRNISVNPNIDAGYKVGTTTRLNADTLKNLKTNAIPNLIGKINTAENKVRNVINPKTEQEKRIEGLGNQLINETKDYSTNIKTYNDNVEKFNKDFSGEITTQSQLNEYNKRRSELEQKQSILNQQQNYIKQKISYVELQEKVLRTARENKPSTFVKSALVGAVTSPITTAALGLDLLSNPVGTIKGQYEGIKQLPAQIKQSPTTTLGELSGNIVGGLLLGRVIGKVGRLGEAENIRVQSAINKYLKLPREIKFKTVGTIKKQTIKNRLISEGVFVNDPNVQSLIKTGDIGKAVTRNNKGVETTRYILKGGVNGKEVTLTFKATKTGKIQTPRVALSDKTSGLTEVYKPATTSQLPEGININEALTLEGVYAKSEQVLKNLQKQVGEKTVSASEVKATTFKVGKGSNKIVTYNELIKNQLRIIRLLKEPKPVSQTTVKSIEILKEPKQIFTPVGEEIINLGEVQKGIRSQRGIINPIDKSASGIIVDDIKNIINNLERKNKQFNTLSSNKGDIKITSTSTPQVTSQVINTQQLSNIISNAELGFNLQPPKIQTSKLQIRPSQQLFIPGELKTTNPINNLNLELEQSKILKELRQINKPNNVLVPVVKISSGNAQRFNQINTVAEIQTPNVPEFKIPNIPEFKIPNIPEFKIPNIPKTRFVDFPPYTPSSSNSGLGSQKTNGLIRAIRRRQGKYTASLGAAFAQAKPIKVSKKEFERLSRQTYSGIETRPVLSIEENNKVLRKQLSKVNF